MSLAALPLPVHPGIAVLELPNGLTCWIRPHSGPCSPSLDSPKGTSGSVCLGLHVGVGSLDEQESERGVSHLLEHLAFEGGTHFPPGELGRFFDSLGTRVGRHHNAFTGREWTCYTLSLPDAAEPAVAGALACLADFAYGMSLEPAAVESERRVILEEMRQYHGATTRLRERLLSLLLPGSLVAERHPLGTEEVVRSVTVAELRSYYRRWYRPETSTLLVAGAVDPDDVERQVRRYFESWRPAADAPRRARRRIRPLAAPRAAVFIEPEARGAELRLAALRPSQPVGTLGELRSRLAEEIVVRLVNRRLGTSIREGQAPFGSAHLGLAPLVRGWSLVQAVAAGSPERWQEVLEALTVEMARVRVHGFSVEEVERARDQVLSAARRALREAGSARAEALLMEMNDAVPRGRPPMSEAQRLELLETVLPALAPGELGEAFSAGLDPSARLAVVTLPARAGIPPTAEEVLRIREQAAAGPIPPPAVGGRTRCLLESRPEPGTVAEEWELPELGVVSSRLANGALVHLRPMESPNRVYVGLSLAGGRIRERAENLGITGAAALAFSQVTAASRTSTEIRDALAGTSVDFRCSVGEDAVVLRIACEPRDLEQGLELIHLLLTEPRLEAPVLERWQERTAERQALSPEARLAFEAVRLLSGDDPRFRLVAAERARAITLAEARQWLDSELIRAPLEAAIAGDLDGGRARELALRYLASLPERPRRAPDLDALRELGSGRGPWTSRVEAETVTPRAAVLAGWQAAPWSEVDDRRLLKMASQILDQRLYRELRKRRGLTYSAHSSFSPSRAYPRAALFSVAFYTTPERAREAAGVARELVEELAGRGPRESEMEAVRKQALEVAERAENDPKYWSHVLADFTYRRLRAADLKGLSERYASYRREDLRAALERYVTADRRLEVLCLPAPRNPPGRPRIPQDRPDPVISRFLRTCPELTASVEKVLLQAAALRQARHEAFPAGEPRSPIHGPRFYRAEGELCDAIEGLERLARSPAPGESESRAAVRRVMAAVAMMRAESHTLSPARTTTSAAARAELFRAIAAFGRAYADLEQRARACHAPRIPWQIELSTHVAAGTRVREMELWGYKLPRTPAARRSWGERCFLSGTQWNVDSHISPALRYRSLDACAHTLAPRYHALCVRLRAALDALAETAGREAVGPIVRLFPFLCEEYVAATSSPTFARLGLLDFPSLAVSLNNMFRTYAERPLFGTRGADGYTWETYGEVRSLSLKLAYACERLGLSRGDRIAILVARNCRDFYLADFATLFAGLVSVGLPETMADEQLLAMLESTEPSAAVADAASLSRLRGLAGKCPATPRVFEIAELLASQEVPESWSSDSGISPATGVVYGDLDGERTAQEQGIRADGEDDLYTILYTSGSTGTPKGTIVTRRRWAEEMCFEAGVWPYVGVSFQPCAAAADRGSVWRALANGGRVGFARRGAAFFHDVRAIRPTLLDAPPVIWNVLYGEYKKAIGDPGLTSAEAARVRLRFRHSLGGRLVFMAIGGAPSDPGVRRTLEEVFGIPMRESYGTTETGNIAADGRLLPGLDYRLIDLPELGFTSGDQPHPRGELAVRTPRTMARYWDDEPGTGAGFTGDGYFLTGDVVEIGPGRQVTLLGRRRQFFKLADSEFVSPQRLEEHYLTSAWVEAVVITGSPLRTSVAAVAVPSRDGVTAADVLADFRAIARREGLRPAEIPAGVVLVPRIDGEMPWTAENGLLTPSLKLNRRALEARYRDEVETIYARRESVRVADHVPQQELADPAASVVRIAAALLAREPGEIDAGRSFLELGGDSVSAMELVLRLEQVFPGKGQTVAAWTREPKQLVESPLEEVARRLLPLGRQEAERTSAERTVARAASRRSPGTSTGGESADGACPTKLAPSDASLADGDAASFPLPDPLPPVSTEGHVLLTGATGFLGVHLLSHLSSSLPPGRRVYALVRASDDGAARERLVRALGRAALEVPAIGLPAAERGAQVIALAGSLAAERFGLVPETYALLAGEVGLIYHVAAEVSFAKSYRELRDTNVVGTRRVLELATETTLKALHFVSSLNVALLLRHVGGRRVVEDSPLPRNLTPKVVEAQPGYGVSKWVCERMIGELFTHCRGAFRASVSRPALIVWSATTGVANHEDWLSRVLASCLALRRAIGVGEAGILQWIPETPVSARGLDMVPVDFAARAVSRIGELTRTSAWPGASGPSRNPVPTFHVSNTAAAQDGHTTWAHLMDLLVAADLRRGGPNGDDPPRILELVPFAEWSLYTEIESAPVLPILPQVRKMSHRLERTEAGRFAEIMAGLEDCPAVDPALVETFIGRFPFRFP